MTDQTSEPVVTANDQGADAVAQAGVVAHNDIAAATNDPTDAPKLEPVTIDETNMAELASIAALDGERIEVTELAPVLPDQTPAPDADPLGPATDELPTTGGIWQCQNLECPNKPTREFEAAAQQHIQFSGRPLHCPFCDGISVLYLHDAPIKEEVTSG